MTKSSYGVGCIGLTHHDEVVFRSFLSLLSAKLHQPWEFVAPDRAGVLIVDVDARRVPRRPDKLVVLYTRAPNRYPHRPVLSKPLRSASLLELLNGIADVDRGHAVNGNRKTGNLCQLLGSIGQTSRVIFDSGILFVDPIHRRFAVQGPSDLPRLLASRERLAATVEPCSFPQDLAFRPLATLVWIAAMYAPGKVEATPLVDAPVKLSRWPNHELKDSDYFRIAGFLSKHWATSSQVARSTQVSLAKVRRFVKACQDAGYLRVDGEAMVTGPRRKPGIIDRIRARLGL